MTIRKANAADAEDFKILYFVYFTKEPPKEEQDMDVWQKKLEKSEKDEKIFLLVAEEDGKVVSSIKMAIVESLTHNVRPFAVIENVVTHENYRNRGFASALLQQACKIEQDNNYYKAFLETGSNK